MVYTRSETKLSNVIHIRNNNKPQCTGNLYEIDSSIKYLLTCKKLMDLCIQKTHIMVGNYVPIVWLRSYQNHKLNLHKTILGNK